MPRSFGPPKTPSLPRCAGNKEASSVPPAADAAASGAAPVGVEAGSLTDSPAFAALVSLGFEADALSLAVPDVAPLSSDFLLVRLSGFSSSAGFSALAM